MTRQTCYARMLHKEGLGDGVYQPTSDVNIGDVAYFTENTYHRCFNVFELSDEEADRLNVPPFHLDNTVEKTEEYQRGIYKSENVEVVTVGLDAQTPGIPELVDFSLQVKKSAEAVAICLPSAPITLYQLKRNGVDGQLRKWWKVWRHNIYRSLQIPRGVEPLFLVLEKADTEQFANCYYKGETLETELRLSAQVLSTVKLALQAGFSFRENGCFDFTQSFYRQDLRKRFAIFIRTEKAGWVIFETLRQYAVSLWHRMCQKKRPTKRPTGNWSSGRSASGSYNTSGNTNGRQMETAAGSVVDSEIFSLTPSWTFIKAGDSYYAEYHGSTWPEELEGEAAENFALGALEAACDAIVVARQTTPRALYTTKEVAYNSPNSVNMKLFYGNRSPLCASFPDLPEQRTPCLMSPIAYY